jgi:cation transport protein ChaC
MWDGWEANYGCTRGVIADLMGYCRRFNKKSVRNWGTPSNPGPTLNLSKLDAGVCRGVAFEFADAQTTEILSYLEEREGKAFVLENVVIRLEDQSEVSALVSLYNGPNIIEGKNSEELAAMVLAASGTEGSCLSYVKGVAEKLAALKISDPAVSDLWDAVITLCSPRRAG